MGKYGRSEVDYIRKVNLNPEDNGFLILKLSDRSKSVWLSTFVR